MSVLGVEVRRPRRTIARKSEGLTTRFALASTSLDYAESSVRPLRRRAARMARPARVRIRRRKPCFLARRRLFGWKVRLLMVISPGPGVCGDRERTGSAIGCRQPVKNRASTGNGQTVVHNSRPLSTSAERELSTGGYPQLRWSHLPAGLDAHQNPCVFVPAHVDNTVNNDRGTHDR